MAVNGYVRQSAADIQPNLTINSADFNNEFNTLQTAFDATSGHAHDGTTGGGQAIVLTTSVQGQLPLANGGTAYNAASADGLLIHLGVGSTSDTNFNSITTVAAGAIGTTLTVTGASTLTGAVAASSTLSVAGLASLTTLAVSGTSSLNGVVSVATQNATPSIKIGSGNFPVEALSGVSIANSTGNHSFFVASNDTISVIMGVQGTGLNNAKVGTLSNSDLAVVTNNTNQIYITAAGAVTISGAVSLSSTLGVIGAATLSSTLAVSGTSTIHALSATSGTFSTTLGVTGNATVGGTLGVTGTTTLAGFTATSGSINGKTIDHFANGNTVAIVFYQAAAPTGWTQATVSNDAVLMCLGNNTAGSSGGTWTISGLTPTIATHALSVDELAAHTHTVSAVSSGATFLVNSGNIGAAVNTITSSSTGSGTPHGHTGSTISSDASWRPAYLSTLIASKN